MQVNKNSIYFKIGSIFIITILLLIPTSMIQDLIQERELNKKNAVKEVSAKWGESQHVNGPIISIPYYSYVKIITDNKESFKPIKHYLHVLPSKLSISGTINPEKRFRGVYEIIVYNSKLELSGSFDFQQIKDSGIELKDIQFDKAEFVIGISDLRGIEEEVNLSWNDKVIPFNPGLSSLDVIKTGINAKLDLNNLENQKNTFNINLDLKGSELLYFTPVGKVTDVNLTSNWSNPSFNGAFLPDSREINESGFTANWNILHLNKRYPQIWSNNFYSINESAFGIDLIIPVDNYQKSYRSIRYALLLIGLTFLVFFFIEIFKKIFIHPIQYILVGFALTLFYTLLLSLSEQISFNFAFAISSLATLLLVVTYVKAILRSTSLAVLISGILSILYFFIFVIIQLEDLALLMGSIGIFLILGLVMYFSREIDWNNLSVKKAIS